MIEYKHTEGLPFVPGLGGGLNVPQVFAKDFASDSVTFTDDLIFSPSKKGLFQALVLVGRSDEVQSALQQVQGISAMTKGRVREDEATVLIHDLHAEYHDAASSEAKVARIASGEEFAANVRLSRNRPPPKFYEPFSIVQELGSNTAFVILRPDRFIYASCSTRQELWDCLKRLSTALQTA